MGPPAPKSIEQYCVRALGRSHGILGVVVDMSAQDSSLENFGAKPVDACINYRQCGNRTPGSEKAGNLMCDSCLDEVRHADSPL